MDVMNFHPLEAVEAEIRGDLAKGNWCARRLTSRAFRKVLQAAAREVHRLYGLVQSLNVPYLVACFFTFDNYYGDVTRGMILDNLHSAASGFFRASENGYPDVSGLVTFYEDNLPWYPPDSVATVYVFDYDENPHAARRCGFVTREYYPPMSIANRDHYKLCVRRFREEIDQFRI